MRLDLKYRPKTFEDVVGQKATSVILSAMVAKNSLSQILLFTGASGVGKTSMARIVAAQLNPEAAQDVHEGIHPAVLEIDGASNGSVEAIRQLKRDLNYVIPGHRVVIIDEVHAISAEAFAALLNLLEFPPTNVTFILITTESHKIPKTIRHRCDKYKFKEASIQDLRDRLSYICQEESFSISDDLLYLIANQSEGSYRESCKILEQISVAGITTVEQYNELQGEVDYGPSILRSALDGPVAIINQLESILRYSNTEEVSNRTIETLKDVMVLKGGTSLNYSGTALESRLELAAKIKDVGQILKAMRIMWDLQTKLNAGDPVRGLELAFSLMGDVFKAQETIPTVTTPAVSSRMSFEEMKKLQR